MTVWREVVEALEAIIEDYERVNHIISFFQDDRARWRGLEKTGSHGGVSLELGSGPGNVTRMLYSHAEGFLVCLDYSNKMLSIGRARNRNGDIGFIRGLFEALPFREGVLSFAAAAYALRDSTDKLRTLREINHAFREGGQLLIIDIGKPDNPFFRGFFSLYMRFVVPILGGFSTGYGYRNPWSILYKTYAMLPVNDSLREMMENIFGYAELEELTFGGLIVAIARKS